MFKKPLFWEICFLTVVVGILDYIANIYHLYWSANEFDSVVHFFGGATSGIFFLWLYFFSGFFSPKSRNLRSFISVAILGSIFVAVSWEIFELLLGEAEIQKNAYPYDTTMDFAMDLFGIIAAVFYGYIKELEGKKVKSL